MLCLKAVSVLVMAALAAPTALAQPYTLDWSTIDGGGGTLAGTAYTIIGTIGQPDAGDALRGTHYTLTGGFWAPAAPPCGGDFNGDGFVDFFDVQSFLNAYASAHPSADVNGDGLLDFFDLSRFLNDFAAGCP